VKHSKQTETMNTPDTYPATLAETQSIKWNTGALYTADGQKCAAALVGPSLVLFVDISRGLDYHFRCKLSRHEIMQEYLNNRSVHVPFTDAQRTLRMELEILAFSAPSVTA
jgi:hypothetical protein